MKKRENELHIISVTLDLLLLNISLFFFAFLLFSFEFETNSYIYLGVILTNLAWLLAYIFVPKRIIYIKKGFRQRFQRFLRRMVLFLILQSVLIVPVQGLLGGIWLYLFYSATFFLIVKLCINYCYYSLVKRRHRMNDRVRTSILIGVNDQMATLRKMMDYNPQLNFKFAGFLSNKTSGDDILGTPDDFAEVVKSQHVSNVFISIKAAEDYPNRVRKDAAFLYLCNQLGVRLYYVYPTPARYKAGDHEYNGTVNHGEEHLNGLTIMNPQKIPLDSIENQIKKRIFDIVFSGLVIVLFLSWLYPVLAILIKLSSKGPVLFKQQRTGINKVTFDCYKFRSMLPNQEANLKQATTDDPRITRIGRFIRKTNIDELPQFFNVLRGDMSVVGPRPHMLRHTDEYSKLVEDYLVRHYVKPGITGYAQVSGLRGETDELWKMEKRVEYDKLYINNWSLEWDLEIVWKTAFSLKAFMNAG